MDMATALAGLGVTKTSIDAETRDRLDRDGYAPLPGVLSGVQLTAAEASNSTRRSTPGRRPWPA